MLAWLVMFLCVLSAVLNNSFYLSPVKHSQRGWGFQYLHCDQKMGFCNLETTKA